MIEAFVGLVGGGKTYSSTRRMCEYVVRGGVVVTNILFKGFDPGSQTFSPDSPFLSYLRSRGWEYQPGQYSYISFDTMVSSSDWFKDVKGGSSRDKRTLLCIDEATDLFDTLDRNKLTSNSAYRELFRFLRLSRHAHIDVLFICQDFFAINSRLRGLCGAIWKSTDLKNFRLPTFHVPLPFNCFLLQKFDRTGRLELFREFISKDSRIFSIYESEAFHDSLGISFTGVVGDGRITGGKKMTTFQKLLLFLSIVFSLFLLVRVRSIDKRLDKVLLEARTLKHESPPNVSSPSTDHVPDLKIEIPKDTFIRGDYQYSYLGSFPELHFDGALIRVGMLTEYGKCVLINPTSALCVDGDHRVYLLPCRGERPPKTTAFALSAEGTDDRLL